MSRRDVVHAGEINIRRILVNHSFSVVLHQMEVLLVEQVSEELIRIPDLVKKHFGVELFHESFFDLVHVPSLLAALLAHEDRVSTAEESEEGVDYKNEGVGLHWLELFTERATRLLKVA